jgi:hypothetical protein
MLVNETVYTRLTPEKVHEIVEGYRSTRDGQGSGQDGRGNGPAAERES